MVSLEMLYCKLCNLILREKVLPVRHKFSRTVGSVVKIPTAVAYEEWSEMMATLQYNPRSHIYGVIHEHTTRGGCKVHYAIRGMFDLGFDSVEEINEKGYEELELTQVRLACDGTYGNDCYL